MATPTTYISHYDSPLRSLQRTTAGAGTEYAVKSPPSRSEVLVSWTYDFLTAAPGAAQVDLESSMDETNWYQRDTYNTAATKTSRKASIGSDKFVRVRLVSVTIGTCTGVISDLAI